MLHEKLLRPASIAVIGGSDHIDHIGGSVLKNLIDQGFKGQLFVVNPKKDRVQGITSLKNVSFLPQIDLAIIAIPADDILASVRELIAKKETKGFIIYAAGFSELDDSGASLEKQIADEISASGGSLLGPNNIGMINQHYAGIFTRPLPLIDRTGLDFISASGATAVFTLEAAQQIGLRFSNLFTVGNSAQIGVEDILEHLDKTFNSKKGSPVKMLYLEDLKNPKKLLKHALSLRQKGCSIIALKSGVTEKGNAAAASHTGAMANSDLFVQALFDKAGIIRCKSRYELITLGAILQTTHLKLKNFAVITHAGGPGVIVTDTLSENGLVVPDLDENHRNTIARQLYPGAATANPIDILATGTAGQLEKVINYCENELSEIDAMIIIFGSPGLGSVNEAYEVIHQMIKKCRKPIFPIFPSVVNVKNEIAEFIKKGHMAFSDEYSFSSCLAKVMGNQPPMSDSGLNPIPDQVKIRSLINSFSDGFLEPDKAHQLLEHFGIPVAKQVLIKSENQLLKATKDFNYPVVQKVVGPLHKSDHDGVLINVSSDDELIANYRRLIQNKEVTEILIQEMIKGKEVFIGAKREASFPPLIMCGSGGIYIEALKDYTSVLAPIDRSEAINMVDQLRIKPILMGMRGEPSCNLEALYDALEKVSKLMQLVPEITELDLNPLILNKQDIVAVDIRIRIEK
ncbi:MAG: CoA-binding protein [Flavobacteriales bacterium]|nr:CoA-binding protein [Flavobacteriales bacterium]